MLLEMHMDFFLEEQFILYFFLYLTMQSCWGQTYYLSAFFATIDDLKTRLFSIVISVRTLMIVFTFVMIVHTFPFCSMTIHYEPNSNTNHDLPPPAYNPNYTVHTFYPF